MLMLDFSCIWQHMEMEGKFSTEARLSKFSKDSYSDKYWKRNLYCAWQAYHNPKSGRRPRLYHLCSTLMPTVAIFKGRRGEQDIYHLQFHYNLRGRFLC